MRGFTPCVGFISLAMSKKGHDIIVVEGVSDVQGVGLDEHA
jgi:hypothetical protein